MKRLLVAALCLSVALAQTTSTSTNVTGNILQPIDPSKVQIQVAYMNLFGRGGIPFLLINGQDYGRADRLNAEFNISQQSDTIVRVEKDGVVLLLPIDTTEAYAAQLNYNVQIGSKRIVGRAATLHNGRTLFLPLSTLAEAFGYQYVSGDKGSFVQPSAQLTNVASKIESKYDRLVIEINRNVKPVVTFSNNRLKLQFNGVGGSPANYTTGGQFVKMATVENNEKGLAVTMDLPSNTGYRYYSLPAQAGGRARVVLDVGNIFKREESQLAQLQEKPVIVLDAGHGGKDTGVNIGKPEKEVTLELSRQVGALLSKAGWQVRYTRTADVNPDLNSRADLARKSNVFLSLHLGAFPGASRNGITVYQSDGSTGLAIIDRIRNANNAKLFYAVSPYSSSQRLSNQLRSDLEGSGFQVSQGKLKRNVLLNNAPHAALLVELAWPQDENDAKLLRSGFKMSKMAESIARSVATYLTPKNVGTL